MTELIFSRGDTFPRSFLDTYRASKSELYNELASSKSDELVLQNSMDIPVPEEIHHGRSENLLDITPYSTPTKEDFLDDEEVLLPKPHRRKTPVDPEDSIRDMVSDNDFYKFVLFKKHYDKYLHLSQKYEEARNIAYYLEEKYHEVKTERDDLIKQRDQLTKKLESNECLLREKEDEVFVQFERVLFLEEQCDKLKAEKKKCQEQTQLIEKEKARALIFLQEQAKESEYNRRKLERARQEVVHRMTKIKNEKDSLERENDQLKEALEAERRGMGNYLIRGRELNDNLECMEKEVEQMRLKEKSNNSLKSQFQKAVEHLATCRAKKCSVCAHIKSAYRKMSPNNRKERKLFSCLQTPFLEMRNMIKPPPSPIHSDGENLSEWFCNMESIGPSECSSLNVPFSAMSLSYMDNVSDSSSFTRDDDLLGGLNPDNRNSFRGFGSDSGFSSEVCGTPKEKFCPKNTLDETDCSKLTRTKWTASFRKLVKRMRK
nr:tax1-binding protein 1 homolog [Leptinotarsa decemlineata]